jgi:hypothetical protein
MSIISEDELRTCLDKLDDDCLALYLEVPGSKIVQLQAIFEICEDVAITRTLSVAKSMICLLTTPSMLNDCLAILDAIRNNVPHDNNIHWKFLPIPSPEERDLYHGYSRKARQEKSKD